ncbi:DNA cytosine methyltransferase [Escherichia coli]|nr:DNA cytosine methyltransferase [Escherichia coli]CTU22616.1 DNA cytosine methylase [Escherichia coli]
MTAERTEAAITTSHNDKSPASIHKLLVQVASVEVVNKNWPPR